jgi:hypothetical protein
VGVGAQAQEQEVTPSACQRRERELAFILTLLDMFSSHDPRWKGLCVRLRSQTMGVPQCPHSRWGSHPFRSLYQAVFDAGREIDPASSLSSLIAPASFRSQDELILAVILADTSPPTQIESLEHVTPRSARFLTLRHGVRVAHDPLAILTSPRRLSPGLYSAISRTVQIPPLDYSAASSSLPPVRVR